MPPSECFLDNYYAIVNLARIPVAIFHSLNFNLQSIGD